MQADGLADAAVEGGREVGSAVYLTAGGITKTLTGRVAASNLGTPVQLTRTAYRVADYSFFWFIRFLGYISLGFAFTNLLPVPILDGGEMLLLAIEFVMGQSLAPSTRRTAYVVGAAVLLLWTSCGVAVELLQV